MGTQSKVAMLPEELRNELERRIVEQSFSHYQDLADWLHEQGYQIAEDNVQRYGYKLKQELEARDRAVHLAKALAEAAPGAGETIVDAAIGVINQRVFSALVEAEQLDLDALPRFVRMAAELTRTTIARQRRAEEVRAQLEQQKQSASKPAPRKGLSEETYHAIRNTLLGINPFARDVPPASPDAAPSQVPANAADHQSGGFIRGHRS